MSSRNINTEINRGENLGELKEQAQGKIMQAQIEAQQEEQEARDLEIQLLEAQANEEKRKESEEHGRETKEKIDSVTG